MTEFLTWELLGTFVGAATAVTVLTQITKQLIGNINPKWIALVLALLVSFGTQIVNGDMAAASFLMSALNALVIAGAAIGAFEGMIKPFTGKNKE